MFGVVGYFMKKLATRRPRSCSRSCSALLAERALRQALIISDAGIFILFMRPISATLTVLALVAIAVPVFRA